MKTFGEWIHADLWGEAEVVSITGAKYSIDFHDDATRYMHINFLKEKSSALQAYKMLDTVLENQFKAQIKYLRTNRGGEFDGIKFDLYLKSRGTGREYMVHDTHEQVGVAE